MENKDKELSIKEQAQQALEEVKAEKITGYQEWKSNPYLKAGLYLTGAILIVWTSQYVFAALEGAIREYKKLKRTINQK